MSDEKEIAEAFHRVAVSERDYERARAPCVAEGRIERLEDAHNGV